MVVIVPPFGTTPGQPKDPINKSQIAGYTNVVWDYHWYAGNGGYVGTYSGNLAYWNNTKSFGTPGSVYTYAQSNPSGGSLDGQIPLILTEMSTTNAGPNNEAGFTPSSATDLTTAPGMFVAIQAEARQGSPTYPQPTIPIEAISYWTVKTDNQTETGVCPTTPPMNGTTEWGDLVCSPWTTGAVYDCSPGWRPGPGTQPSTLSAWVLTQQQPTATLR